MLRGAALTICTRATRFPIVYSRVVLGALRNCRRLEADLLCGFLEVLPVNAGAPTDHRRGPAAGHKKQTSSNSLYHHRDDPQRTAAAIMKGDRNKSLCVYGIIRGHLENFQRNKNRAFYANI